MFNIGVKSDLEQMAKAFDKMSQQQVPYATMLTLNRIAEFSKATLISTMRRVFDRPTPFILNSLYISYAKKTNLQANIQHKNLTGKGNLPSSYPLQAEIKGGPRAMKRSEKILGSYYVPAKYAELDAYGNISGAQIKKMLSALGMADNTSGYTSNVSGKSKLRARKAGRFVDYVKNPVGLPRGIYKRSGDGSVKGRGLIPYLYFVDKPPTYHARYDMQGVVDRVIKAEFDRVFYASMDYALSTGKVRIRG